MKIEILTNGQIEVTNGEFKLIHTSIKGIKFNTATRMDTKGSFKVVGIYEYPQFKQMMVELSNLQNAHQPAAH